MTFSPSTLAVFSDLLGSVQLPLSHPEFEQMAARAGLAKKELAAALADAEQPPADDPA